MLCGICKGSGHLLICKGMQFWECPACGGQGVTLSGMVGPEIKLQKSAGKRRKAKNKT